MSATALAPGFRDPVRDAQAVFRAVMDALASPGTVRPLPPAALPGPPAPLTPELGAIALALADHEAPLWLDAPLAAAPAVAEWLRFHTGAPVAADPAAAAFALVADPPRCPPLPAFAQGTPDYPDRSATVVLAVEALSAAGGGLTLEGPGIPGRTRLSAAPLPPDFAGRLASNRAAFPLGVDHLLAAPGAVAGLPRSARVVAEG